MYINDIKIALNNSISEIADDTKIRKSLIDDCGRLNLQEDLRKISEWFKRWEMPFLVNKCHIFQLGTRNQKFYEMSCIKTESLQCVKDLCVTIALNHKFSQQCKDAEGKTNRMLGFMNRNYFFRNGDIILPLYITLARLHLEYGVEIWKIRHAKDITKL